MGVPNLLDNGPIPAGAGETAYKNALRVIPGAYPRWRGGNTYYRVLKALRSGLSPLARGKHVRDCGYCRRSGPIPAGAGETSCTLAPRCTTRAYPRWRGGN